MAMDPWMTAGAGGMMGAGIGQMFAPWKNPSNAAMPSMNQIPGQIQKYMDPTFQAGQRQLPGLEHQYGQLMNDPGSRLNEIGQGYHQSPGFQFALQQALQGGNHAAAAGGMAGSPQHEQQNMGLATNLANQDYNSWMGNALGLYGQGMAGSQGLYDTGAHMGQSIGEDMSSYLANKAKLAYEGQNRENEHTGGEWGSFLGGAGQLAAMSAFL